MRQRLQETWRRWSAGLSFDAAAILLAATVVLILYHENGSSAFYRSNLAPFFRFGSLQSLYPAFYWYACSLLFLGLLPYLFGRMVLGFAPAQMGVAVGDWRFGLKAVFFLYAAFLPLLVAANFLPAFRGHYPLFFEAADSAAHFFAYELAYLAYFIGWEFVFRGFLLFGLEPALGFHAVFVQTVPFALLHFGKPQLETLAAVPAGVILGYLALRARSFWYGFLLHGLVAVSNDLLAMTIGRG